MCRRWIIAEEVKCLWPGRPCTTDGVLVTNSNFLALIIGIPNIWEHIVWIEKIPPKPEGVGLIGTIGHAIDTIVKIGELENAWAMIAKEKPSKLEDVITGIGAAVHLVKPNDYEDFYKWT